VLATLLLLAAAPPALQDGPDYPQMVIVPAGTAVIGSTPEERAAAGTPAMFGDREGPVREVRIAHAFALGRTEVTRAQYARFVTATRRPDPANCGIHNAATDSWAPLPGYNWHNPGYPQGDTDPAVCISYDDAQAYVAWLSRVTGSAYRLPSESEWEYAARAGAQTAWPWGAAAETGCDRANVLSSGDFAAFGMAPSVTNRIVCASARKYTMPVASFSANAFGLYDMIGNAFEWVSDCYTDSHAALPADGSAVVIADCKRHFLKGGAFHTPLWLTRSAARGNAVPADLHMFTIGFRVARDIT
jgi:sulfatase modifying factor 1